jgi:hypothetical protein
MYATTITIDGLSDLLKALKESSSRISDLINQALWYDGLRTGVALGFMACLALWMFANHIKKGS